MTTTSTHPQGRQTLACLERLRSWAYHIRSADMGLLKIQVAICAPLSSKSYEPLVSCPCMVRPGQLSCLLSHHGDCTKEHSRNLKFSDIVFQHHWDQYRTCRCFCAITSCRRIRRVIAMLNGRDGRTVHQLNWRKCSQATQVKQCSWTLAKLPSFHLQSF